MCLAIRHDACNRDQRSGQQDASNHKRPMTTTAVAETGAPLEKLCTSWTLGTCTKKWASLGSRMHAWGRTGSMPRSAARVYERRWFSTSADTSWPTRRAFCCVVGAKVCDGDSVAGTFKVSCYFVAQLDRERGPIDAARRSDVPRLPQRISGSRPSPDSSGSFRRRPRRQGHWDRVMILLCRALTLHERVRVRAGTPEEFTLLTSGPDIHA